MIRRDVDPILEQKFFDLLFPLAFPDLGKDSAEYIFSKQRLSSDASLINNGGLLEQAISVQKGISRYSTIGKDFVDGSDAKCSSCRWHSNLKAYGAPITDIKNKKGLLRCVVYERLLDKFYYFLIPHKAYEWVSAKSNIEIPFNLDGTPRRNSKHIRNIDWWQFEMNSFKDILLDYPNHYEFAADKRKKLKTISELRNLNTPLLDQHSPAYPKNRPNVQISNPCILGSDL